MGTKVNSNYEDLLTFTRASKGHALRPVSYGTERSPNVTFTGNIDGWRALNANATATAENNELKVVTTNISGAILDSSITLEVGKIYRVSATSTSTTVGHMMRLGSGSSTSSDILLGTASYSPTTFTHTFVATSTVLWIYLRNKDGAGTVTWDNISVKEVTFDQPDGTLTLFEHPTNVPRVEYDADGNRLGLLVEEARTNLVYGSTSPPTDGSTKTLSDRILSPAQQLNADLFKENTSTSAHGLRRTGILPTQGATDYTISVYAKAKERRYLQLRLYANSTSNDVFGFDLQEGTAPAGGSIENVGNGWYRCSATLNVNNSTGGFNFAAAQMGSDSVTYYYAGDGSSGMYIFGLQVEAGSFSTSYIKNDGLSGGVTRSADVASIPVADFGYNQSAGSLLITATPYDASPLSWFAAFGSSASNSIQFYTSLSSVRTFIRTGGVDQTGVNSVNTISDNTTFSFAAGFQKDDVSSVVDGGTLASDTTVEMPNIDGSLNIGLNLASVSHLNGHIKSIKYYPRRLTNAQLQEITS